MPPGQLDGQPAAERKAAHVRAPEPEGVDEVGQAVRVARETEVLRRVEGPPAPRGVPRDDREVVAEAVELRQPIAAVREGPVQQDQRWAIAPPPVRDAATGEFDVLDVQLSVGAVAVTIQVEAWLQIVPSSR